MKVCIVIPAYNEEDTISEIIAEAKKYSEDIIVVDDGSKDATHKLAEESGAFVLRHVVNLGVGSATVIGNDYAVSRGFDVIVNLDSDGQHSASALSEGLELLEGGGYDIVIGSRFLESTKKMPVILKLGNKFLTLVNKTIFGSDITDTQSGFRIVTADAWKKLAPISTGYSICSEISASIGTKRLKYAEIPIETIYLDTFKGTTIFDGIKIFVSMFRWWFRK
jgi:glycosyltransferase involved in cell wall biosynthesis